jgi:hypothetical protein
MKNGRNAAILRCTLCKTGLMGQDSFDSHLRGKRHKQNVAQRGYGTRNTVITEEEQAMALRRLTQPEESMWRRLGRSTKSPPPLLTSLSPRSASTLRRDPYFHALHRPGASCDLLLSEDTLLESRASHDVESNDNHGAGCSDVSVIGLHASRREPNVCASPCVTVPCGDCPSEVRESRVTDNSCSPSRPSQSGAVHVLDTPDRYALDSISIYSDDDDLSGKVAPGCEAVVLVSDDESISGSCCDTIHEHLRTPTSVISSQPTAQVIDLCDDCESRHKPTSSTTTGTGREQAALLLSFDCRTRRLE